MTTWIRTAATFAPSATRFALATTLASTLVSLAAACSSSAESSASNGARVTAPEIAGVTFRAPLGQFVGAQNAGGGAVIATATAAAEWETFTLVDQNGGALESGDLVFLRAWGGQYLQAANGGGSTLNAASANEMDWESFRVMKASGTGAIHDGDVVGLQTKTSGNWVSAANAGGGTVFAYGAALGDWEKLTIGLPSSGNGNSNGNGNGGTPDAGSTGPAPDFGPNVFVFDPSMSAANIQSTLDRIFGQQETNQFGDQRYAFLFKPGIYDNDVKIGFYMTALGLGASPDDVTIRGAVRSKADWFNGNATQNFWRGAENLSIVPQKDGNVDIWAVSQATFLRRIHVKGSINLWDSAYQNAWSSGGFIADSKIDGTIDSGTQQQFLTRNTALGNWRGSNWNMVFVGDNQAPASDWPNNAFTTVDTTPVIREKPFLFLDSSGHYAVKVPPLRTSSSGITWGGGVSAGSVVGLDQFYLARSDRDDASTLNAALTAGKHLLLTPGVYHLASALEITRPGTIVLGLGLATLLPDRGTAAVNVADVDGVTLAGILFDAGQTPSDTLLKVGPVGNGASHAASPILLSDISCRVGGATAGSTSSCVIVNSNDTLIDNAWLWRADHGSGVGWDTNPAKNGIIVNGVNVSAYGLFVEHFEEYQTLWNANNGRVYFYQSEIPYDVPSQSRWTHDGVNGYASFKVADWVTAFDARGLGAYCVFYNPVILENAFETPRASGVSFQHLITVWLGSSGGSAIDHIINGDGATVRSGAMTARTSY